jgi:hypothetical protein
MTFGWQESATETKKVLKLTKLDFLLVFIPMNSEIEKYDFPDPSKLN